MSNRDTHIFNGIDAITRRKLLAATGAVGATALAGCSSGSNDTNNTNNGGGGNQDIPKSVDAKLHGDVARGQAADELGWNPFAQKGSDLRVHEATGVYLAGLNLKTFDWAPMLAKSWKRDGEKFYIDLNKNFTWHHNETSVTAEDIVYHLKAHMYFGDLATLSDLVKENGAAIRATKKHQVEVDLQKNVMNGIIKPSVFNEVVTLPADFLSKHVDAYENASSKKAKTKAATGLAEMKIGDKDMPGPGPWTFKERTNKDIEFEYYDKYPMGELRKQVSNVIEFDFSPYPEGFNTNGLRILSVQKGENALRQSIEGNRWFGSGGGDKVRKEWGSNISNVMIPSFYGHGIQYNLHTEKGKKVWQDRRIRQAFAYILDRTAMAQALYGDQPTLNEHITGLPKDLENGWLDQEFIDSLDPYKKDTKKAKKLLNEAGYTKKNGSYIDESGDPLKITMRGPSGISFYKRMFKVIRDQLREFGIKANFTIVDRTTFFGRDLDSGKWQITRAKWGGAKPHPYFSFDMNFNSPKGYFTEDTPGADGIVELPPVGKPDSKETKTFNVKNELDKFSNMTDKKEIRAQVRKLSWIWNRTVPKLGAGEIGKGYFFNRKFVHAPPEEHEILYWSPPIGYYHQLGLVQAKKGAESQ